MNVSCFCVYQQVIDNEETWSELHSFVNDVNDFFAESDDTGRIALTFLYYSRCNSFRTMLFKV